MKPIIFGKALHWLQRFAISFTKKARRFKIFFFRTTHLHRDECKKNLSRSCHTGIFTFELIVAEDLLHLLETRVAFFVIGSSLDLIFIIIRCTVRLICYLLKKAYAWVVKKQAKAD